MSTLPSVPATTVLLLGFVPVIAMAVARSLHRCGVRVVVCHVQPGEGRLRSRAIARFVALPACERPAEEFRDALLRTIEEERAELVIPLTDRALARLLPHLGELRQRTRVACASKAAVQVALDKPATARLAASLGIPTPAEIALPETGSDDGELAGVTFPLFAKCRERFHGDGPLPRRIDDLPGLRAFLADQPLRERHMVQAFVPGDDVGLAVLMHRGRRVATFQYRAAKTWPAEGGICVLARTEAPDVRLVECAERMLQALKWEGLAQLDFRHDPATGRFALLEINARFWGTTGVAVAAGVDFPRYVWQRAGGVEPCVPASYRSGLLVRSIEGEMRRLVELWRSRAAGRRHAWWRECVRFVTDTRPGTRGIFWSWWDPVPAFQLPWNMVRLWLLTRWRRLGASAQ